MEKDNLIIYVSSRNNYDMLEGEVLKNIKPEGFEFINIDDGSTPEEIKRGKEICNKHGIIFLENRARGVQFATQTLIEFINENRPECKWIFCFQHDNYPITERFFSRLSDLINTGQIDQFGSIGFNVIDHGKYTRDSFKLWENGEKPLGILGMAQLSKTGSGKRMISPRQNPHIISDKSKWMKPFTIDFQMWAALGINLRWWNEIVEATTDYQFHLWWPDVAMQLNKANHPCIILPDLYTVNMQELKTKYGIHENSAVSAKAGNEHHFGEYGPHLRNFKARWGWEYGQSTQTYPIGKYEGTFIEAFFNHDLRNGPYESYDIKY